jgi:hypothetical protein
MLRITIASTAMSRNRLDQQGDLPPDEVCRRLLMRTWMRATTWPRFCFSSVPILCFGEGALRPGMRVFFLAEKAVVLDLGAMREVRKGLEADINADLFIRDEAFLWLDFLQAGRDKSPARRSQFNNGRFRCPCEESLHSLI